jgi:hypothetical protein
LSASGELVLVASNPDDYTELARFRPLTGKCWNVPAVSHGRIYVRSTLEAVCLDVALATTPRLNMHVAATPDQDGFRLTIATEDGSPIDATRAATIEVQSAPHLTATSNTWTRLEQGIVLTNGELHLLDPVDRAQPRRFFRALDNP